MRYRIALLTFGLLLLTGCEGDVKPKLAKVNSETARWYSSEQQALGKQLYLQNCSSCHGAAGQGRNNWHLIDETGFYPPPPLNGTGHSWHHSLDQLMEVIELGRNQMPAWPQLSEPQRKSLIAFIQSMWPEAVYQAWLTRELR